ncbi:hypothetical protein [Gymnodinialimonas hymeniacidonis]|uniref:hypothetical protein n=1 Tax=Gymnodinialimonas hymeniacidonis TaxID=3126508 RepID=UPI0034C5F761
MGRWVWIGGAACVALVLYAVWLWQGFVTVQPHQQAVADRGDTLDVLEPGVYVVGGLVRDVTIYDVFLERQHRVADPVMVDQCPVTFLVTYRVGDVLAFHMDGGDYDAIAGQDAALRALMEAADLSLAQLRGPDMDALRVAVQEAAPPGIEILRLTADVGACAGAATAADDVPEVEVVREAMELVQAEADLGELRVEIFDLPLLSRDDARLELTGAVASFDLADADWARTCFGDFETMPGLQVANVVEAGLREVAGSHDRVDVPGAFATLTPPLAPRLEADCGVRIGPVDFSAARLDWLRAAQ